MVGVPLPMGAVVQQMYALMMVAGLGGKDFWTFRVFIGFWRWLERGRSSGIGGREDGRETIAAAAAASIYGERAVCRRIREREREDSGER